MSLRAAATSLGKSQRTILGQTRAYAKPVPELANPVKDAWDAPFYPYEWKHSQQWVLLVTIGSGVGYAFYRVLTHDTSGASQGSKPSK